MAFTLGTASTKKKKNPTTSIWMVEAPILRVIRQSNKRALVIQIKQTASCLGTFPSKFSREVSSSRRLPYHPLKFLPYWSVARSAEPEGASASRRVCFHGTKMQTAGAFHHNSQAHILCKERIMGHEVICTSEIHDLTCWRVLFM